MKFNEDMKRKMVPEWVKIYLNIYLLQSHLEIPKSVKEFLLASKKTKRRSEYQALKLTITDNKGLMEKLVRDNNSFLSAFQDELEKVETFVFWKYLDLKQIQGKLEMQIKMMKVSGHDIAVRKTGLSRYRSWRNLFSQRTTPQKWHDIKEQYEIDERQFRQNKQDLLHTCYKFYYELYQFQQYLLLNDQALKKIQRKYHKSTLRRFRKQFNKQKDLVEMLEKNCLHVINKKVESTFKNVKRMIIMNFYYKNPKHGAKGLKKLKKDDKNYKSNIFILGAFMSYVFSFALLVTFMRFDDRLDPQGDKVFNKVFPCFRGMALFLIYYWVISLDIVAYNYFGINYKIFLDFNYHFSTISQIFRRVSILSLIYLVFFTFYILLQEQVLNYDFIDTRYLPIAPWIIFFSYVLIPTGDKLNGKGRRWMYRMGYMAVIGHWTPKMSELRYLFFTDQIISMFTPFKDLDYTICYYYHLFIYGNEPQTVCLPQTRVISLLPFIIPQLAKILIFFTRARDKGALWMTDEMKNIFKVSLSITVCILSFASKIYPVAIYLWIPAAVISTIWLHYWEMTREWQLFQPNSRYKFLRNDLGYNTPALYYALSFTNLMLRTSWTLNISPEVITGYLGIKSELFVLLLGILEMLRRFISNFVRLEKEHIMNQNALKVVVDYRFPYEVRQLSKNVDEIYEIKSDWSVSTIQRTRSNIPTKVIPTEQLKTQDDFEIEEYDRENVVNSITLMESRQSLQMTQIVRSHSNLKVKSPIFNPAEIEKRISAMSNLLGGLQIPQSGSTNLQPHISLLSFRLSDLVDKKLNSNQSFQIQQLIDNTNINMEIINIAKKREKLQKTLVQKIRQENQEYLQHIKSLYRFYQVSKE